MKELYRKILSMKSKKYGFYKSLSQKTWSFGDFSLEFVHVQGDPYAPASKILLKAPFSSLGYSTKLIASFTQRLAVADFFLRRLFIEIQNYNGDKKAEFKIMAPTQEVLLRNALWIENGFIQILLQVNLPAKERIIDEKKAAHLLTAVLPDLVTSSLYFFDPQVLKDLEAHVRCLEVREELLKIIKEQNLVAFVPNGAILPRASGLSDTPLLEAIPFVSPSDLEVQFEVLGESIVGMGIQKGITVIAGGAYHGKSTLLHALERAVVPHIPGDGREWVVIDESACAIHVEEGRSIQNTDISFFLKNLPGDTSTSQFNTVSASGSTSQVGNFLEALEFGSKCFLIDEDYSAVNFLIRDSRVRALLGDQNEPLTPLIDRIQHLKEKGLNFIIVAGACGAYLEVADQVLLVSNYKISRATQKVLEINSQLEPSVKEDPSVDFEFPQSRLFHDFVKDMLPHVKPTSAVERRVKVRLQDNSVLQIGFLRAQIAKTSLFHESTKLASGYLLLNLLQNPSNEESLKQIEALCLKIQNVGFRAIPQGFSKDLALPRPIDIASALLRLRYYD